MGLGLASDPVWESVSVYAFENATVTLVFAGS
jgi:hypothetical protein